MNETYAREISKWKYPWPYERYSFAGDETEFNDIMNGLHFAVLDKATGELSGFMAIGPAAQVRTSDKTGFYDDESYTDLAFGLKPELCGKGFGKDLVSAACLFAKEHFPNDGIRITAETGNKRAVTLYTKMGFKAIKTFKKSLFGPKLIVMIM